MNACTSMRPIPDELPGVERKRPVLLVHGIDDTPKGLYPLRNALVDAGWRDFELQELLPNDGSHGIDELAKQVDAGARALKARTGAQEIDVVAFSMGSLVSRYWLTRMERPVAVRNFISISGPHHGTVAGYFRWNTGATQMRPSSPLIRDLASDEGNWRGVTVYSFWTPFDLMIFPARSSRLKGAIEQQFPVIAHPAMLIDRRVHEAVIAALDGKFVPRNELKQSPAWP